jgi:hypothetical protein
MIVRSCQHRQKPQTQTSYLSFLDRCITVMVTRRQWLLVGVVVIAALAVYIKGMLK